MSFDASASLTISDPNARALSSSCFDFLLIELVPMAERLAKQLSTSTEETEPEDEEVRESTYFRLDSLGYRVGQGLAERYVTVLLRANWA
ncbi:Trafficking protein particle complex subunit 6B [Penicillium cosmopolitanum]|uniref:Trafficking protein particle complex subunit 6B n=1 Tax=Penicillium cosmopolitanum TaxID=1131564 RepID=A0A9W9W2E8_9EURO|nr:Trafficking protein particle complex subunit 6B [Penicillium cosmopolitanum]KAJ5397267.1 Trafficking protein particle complex subunit 6B [Penicillium cosmopolitanum]